VDIILDLLDLEGSIMLTPAPAMPASLGVVAGGVVQFCAPKDAIFLSIPSATRSMEQSESSIFLPTT
jgi:hypothetical protein